MPSSTIHIFDNLLRQKSEILFSIIHVWNISDPSPPASCLPILVELPSLVVEAVCDLVSDDDADAAVVEALGEGGVVERRLQDARREHWRGQGYGL